MIQSLWRRSVRRRTPSDDEAAALARALAERHDALAETCGVCADVFRNAGWALTCLDARGGVVEKDQRETFLRLFRNGSEQLQRLQAAALQEAERLRAVALPAATHTEVRV